MLSILLISFHLLTQFLCQVWQPWRRLCQGCSAGSQQRTRCSLLGSSWKEAAEWVQEAPTLPWGAFGALPTSPVTWSWWTSCADLDLWVFSLMLLQCFPYLCESLTQRLPFLQCKDLFIPLLMAVPVLQQSWGMPGMDVQVCPVSSE